MRTTLTALSLAALLPAAAAFADDDACSVPRGQWQPRAAVQQLAEQIGWTLHELDVDDGCYEIEGRDSAGREIEVKLDPATLRIVEMEYDDEHRHGGARSPAPAGTVAPPQNGLFGDGAPPSAQVN